VFRELLQQCTTRKGVNWQKLGHMWDDRMEENPMLTPKDTTVFKAAEKRYAVWLGLTHSLCAAQEGVAGTAPRGSSDAAVPSRSMPAGAGAAAAVAGAGAVPCVSAPQVGGFALPVSVVGQLFSTPQGRVLVPPAVLTNQQLAQGTMAAAGLLPVMGSSALNQQMLAAAGLATLPAANQAAAMFLQQQQ
jgi:hypothetical protein